MAKSIKIQVEYIIKIIWLNINRKYTVNFVKIYTFLDLMLLKLRSNCRSICSNSSVEQESKPSPKSFLKRRRAHTYIFQKLRFLVYIYEKKIRDKLIIRMINYLWDSSSNSIFLCNSAVLSSVIFCHKNPVAAIFRLSRIRFM